MKVFSTACPRNCYSTCSMRVFVENGRICRVEANPDNRATPDGVCLRGQSYVERVHHPDRILSPLRRKKQPATPNHQDQKFSGGNSPNIPANRGRLDDFEEISWDEALDTIAEKLTYFKKEYGPQSVLYYYGSGTKGLLNGVGEQFWRMYGGFTATYGDLCWPAGLEATRLTLGDNIHNAPWDIENAKLIVLWGKNPAETNIHQMRSIDLAIEKGAELVVVDPRRTQSCETASLIIQPRPGSDGALAMALAHLLIKNHWVDEDFVEKYVLGYQQFKKRVKSFTAEKAAAICDVPVLYIENLARHIGTIKPFSLCAGYGMQRYTNSGQTMRALIALPVLTGNIGKPGAGWVYANLQTGIFSDLKDPIAFFPPAQPDGVARVSVSVARLGRDMPEQQNPPLKMIWVERGNPVTQNPETHKVLAAFRALDFRVVVEQFLTDTAREADIILPAKTMFEQSDIIGAYWHPYIQLKQKVIEPPGGVKPESEIYRLLALRMGFPESEMAGKIPGPDDAAIEAFLEKKLAPFPGLTLEKLRQGPVLAPGMQEVVFSDLKFPTPSGKIELYSEEAHERWGVDPLPDFSAPIESAAGARRPGKKPPYPLYFMTPNTKNRTHSQFNNLRVIRQFSPGPFAEMNPDDAEARGIKHNDTVRIFNERGELFLPVHLNFSMKSGCVSVSNGWWITEGGGVNFLSMGRETDMAYGSAFHDNMVEVVRVDGAPKEK